MGIPEKENYGYRSRETEGTISQGLSDQPDCTGSAVQRMATRADHCHLPSAPQRCQERIERVRRPWRRRTESPASTRVYTEETASGNPSNSYCAGGRGIARPRRKEPRTRRSCPCTAVAATTAQKATDATTPLSFVSSGVLGSPPLSHEQNTMGSLAPLPFGAGDL